MELIVEMNVELIVELNVELIVELNVELIGLSAVGGACGWLLCAAV